MKRVTEEKLAKALIELADGLSEIREMGLFELRFKFKPILARVEKQIRMAAQAVREEAP
jgi:hypothetical protein